MLNSLKERFLKPKIQAEKSAGNVTQSNTTKATGSSEPELRHSTRGTDNVILHIGLPKTGTTTLQNWSQLNSAALAAEGIFALPNILEGCRLAAQCITNPKRLEQPDIPHIKSLPFDHARRALIEGASREGVHTSMVTSEYFFVADPVQVAKMFAEMDLKVTRVICFVRRQDDLLASGYNQDVKALGRADIYSPPSVYTPHYDWCIVRKNWQHVFPNAEITLHNFDYHRQHGTLIDIFARDIGASSTYKLPNSPTTNESLSAELLEIVRAANAIGLPQIAKLATAAQDAGLVGTPFALNDIDRQTILNNYRDSNARLATEDPLGEFVDFARDADARPGINLTGSFPVEFALKLMAWQINR